MTEIILSFFAAIGFALLISHFFDYLLYRSFKEGFYLVVDLRDKSIEEIIASLELIHTARARKSGEAAIREILVTIEPNPVLRDRVYSYMNLYSIPGKIIMRSEEAK